MVSALGPTLLGYGPEANAPTPTPNGPGAYAPGPRPWGLRPDAYSGGLRHRRRAYPAGKCFKRYALPSGSNARDLQVVSIQLWLLRLVVAVCGCDWL